MNKSYLMSLSLAAVLAVPAVAQQNQTPADQQPQDQTTQTTQTTPATQTPAPAQPVQAQPAQTQAAKTDQAVSATGKDPLKYERHEGFWGKINPFARKKYVNRQLDPVRGRVNELDELTAKNSKNITDVDSRASEGIRNAMSKASEADSHAVDAGNRAGQAQQTAEAAHTRITGVEQTVSKLDQYQPVTQAEIRFRPGQTVLSKNAKEALDQLATTLKAQKGYILEVQGFSPGAGSTAIENSREMAQMVVRYLVLNHDVPVYRIYTVGMGNAPSASDDGKLHRARGGRVEVNLMKNSLGDVNPTSANAAPAGSVTPQ
jgi:outer membrane protein OmpA-like peptidoglycan-associated protein